MATAPEPQAHAHASFWTSTLGPWIWEIVTWLVAAGLLVAMCVILDHANGKPVNDWDLPINLNSLVATLSTLYRALVVAIAAEILSQEKWIWFWSTSSPPRPLLHLQFFDAGTRGLWGAVRLLPLVVRQSIPAVLAVLVVITSFALTDKRGDHISLPNGMELTRADSQPYMLLRVGNLSWAEPVVSPAEAAKYRWAHANVTVLTMTAHHNENGFLQNYTAVSCSLYPCVRSYWAAVERGVSKEEVVHSKPMYPDFGNYTGKDLETIATSGGPFSKQREFWAAVQDPCRINDTIYTASNMSKAANTTTVRLFDPENAPGYPPSKVPEECVYRIRDFFAALTGEFFTKELFNGTCTWDARQGHEADCVGKWWQTRFWNHRNASAESITAGFDHIAHEMTNKFRLGLGRENGTADRAYGVVNENLAYTVIGWRWMSLPVLLLLVETVILAWMMIRSWIYREQEMAWKSSVLPLLYYRDRFEGIEASRMEKKYDLRDGDAADGSLMTAAEMQKDAGRVRVRFVRGLRQDDD